MGRAWRGAFCTIPWVLDTHLWSNITSGGEQILRKVSAPYGISRSRFRGSIIFYTAADIQRASLRGRAAPRFWGGRAARWRGALLSVSCTETEYCKATAGWMSLAKQQKKWRNYEIREVNGKREERRRLRVKNTLKSLLTDCAPSVPPFFCSLD